MICQNDLNEGRGQNALSPEVRLPFAKLVKKITFFSLFFAALIFIPAMLLSAKAVELTSQMNDQKASKENAIYNTELNAPFAKGSNGVREEINPETGAVTVTNKLVSIPGRNGMDLNLSLVYNNQAAKLYDEGTSSPGITVTSQNIIAYYEVYNSQGYWLRTDAIQYTTTGSTVNIQGTTTQNNETWVFNGYYQGPNDTSLTKSASIVNCTRARSVCDSSKYIFGIGWSLNIPYLFVDGASAVYVSMPNGQTYKYDSTNPSGLQNYPLTDVHFGADTSMSNGVNTSAYKLLKADGSSQYFTQYGELMLQMDRYGNQINYFWNDSNGLRILSKIVDTAGRIVTFSYDNTGTTIQYDNKIITLAKAAISGYTGSYNLASYTDPLGNVTYFSYSIDSASFDNFGGTAVNNTYADLNTITYQTGFNTNYTYTSGTKNLATSGSMKYYKVSGRWDSIGSTQYSVQSYMYSNEPDGYPAYKTNSIDANYQYNSTVANKNGETINYWYNAQHQLVKQESIVPGITTTKQMWYDKDLNVPIKTLNTRTVNSTSRTVSVDTFSYDTRGNLISENHPVNASDLDGGEYITSYTYDSQYNLMLTKSYKQDKDTTITVKNTLSDDKKDVIQTDTYSNKALLKTMCFEHDACGNLTKTSTMMSPTKWSVIKTTYGDAYAKVYPTSVADGQASSATSTNFTALKSSSYTYDFYSGKKLSETDGLGNVTSYKYDALDRVLKETLPDGKYRTSVYDDKNNTITTTDAEGGVLKYFYDPFGKLSSVQKTLTGETILKKTYDDKGNVLTTTDANGNVTNYTYDHLNRLTSAIVTDASGKTMSKKLVAYQENYNDTASNIDYRTTETVVGDSVNIVTTNYYNGRGQLIKSGRVSGDTEQFKTVSYDYLGNTVSTVGFDGAKTSGTYNAFGKPLTATDPNGNTTKYGYDGMGNQTSVTNALGITSYTHYDGIGNVIETDVPHGADGTAVTSFYYDADGRLIKTVDPLGGIKKQFYNNRGFLTGVEQVLDSKTSSIVKLDYDGEGRVTAQYTGLSSWDDTNYSVTKFKYDAYGKKISETDPAGKKTTYKYDASGNLLETTDRNGITTYNKYDGLNRVIDTYNSHDGKKKDVSYSYDLNGSLKNSANANQKTDFTYDKFGRVIKIHYDNGSQKEYTYDDGDRVTAFTVKIGDVTEMAISYEYDAGGRRTAVVYKGMRTTSEYNAANQLIKETNGLTAVTTTYGYTDFGTLWWMRSNQAGKIVNNCAYKYDLNGNQTQKLENGEATSYKYDALSRLSIALLPDGTLQYYIFDDSNNISRRITCKGHLIKETDYRYDIDGRLTLKDDGTVQNRYQYDDCGNLIDREDVVNHYGITYSGDISFDYNGYNQLASVSNAGSTYDYTYGTDGLRIGKSSGNIKTGYLYENGSIIIEMDGKNLVTAKNVWNGQLIERDTQDGDYSFRFDGHGDVTALTDKLGNVLKDYSYDPYGNATDGKTSPEDPGARQKDKEYNNPFQYCGEYIDDETGFYYLRARFYDPAIGRFVSEDTYRGQATDTLSLNLYTYCQGDPVNAWDPSGHKNADDANLQSDKITPSSNISLDDLGQNDNNFVYSGSGNSDPSDNSGSGNSDPSDANNDSSSGKSSSSGSNSAKILTDIAVGVGAGLVVAALVVVTAVTFGAAAPLDVAVIGSMAAGGGALLETAAVEETTLADQAAADLDVVGQVASEDIASTLQSIGSKSESYIAKRGWTWDSMQNVVGNSYTTCDAINKATGNAATAYYNQTGDYVVVDNVTHELVQLSKYGDTGWIPDSTITNPYIP